MATLKFKHFKWNRSLGLSLNWNGYDKPVLRLICHFVKHRSGRNIVKFGFFHITESNDAERFSLFFLVSLKWKFSNPRRFVYISAMGGREGGREGCRERGRGGDGASISAIGTTASWKYLKRYSNQFSVPSAPTYQMQPYISSLLSSQWKLQLLCSNLEMQSSPQSCPT
jgi:hypothetical protein